MLIQVRKLLSPFRRKTSSIMYGILATTNIDDLYVKLTNSTGATILMYHSVCNDPVDRNIDPSNSLSLNTFIRHVKFFARNRNVVSLEDLVNKLKTGVTIPAGTVVLTFDDGYVDNLYNVAPVLAKYKMPATLFLPTGYVNRCENQWIDMLFWIVRYNKNPKVIYKEKIYNVKLKNELSRFYNIVSNDLLIADYGQRKQIIDNLVSEMQPNGKYVCNTMNWTQVKELLSKYPNWDIGVHTQNHIDLTSVDKFLIQKEIKNSVIDVICNLGIEPKFFSYPYNRINFEAVDYLKNNGLQAALGSGEQCLLQLGADCHALPRVESCVSVKKLKYYTSGAHPALSQLLFLN